MHDKHLGTLVIFSTIYYSSCYVLIEYILKLVQKEKKISFVMSDQELISGAHKLQVRLMSFATLLSSTVAGVPKTWNGMVINGMVQASL